MVMMAAAAAFAVLVVMVMIVPAAAFALFVVMAVIVAAAALALFVVMAVIVPAAALALFMVMVVIVIVTAPAAALALAVMMVMMAAAAAALNAHRLEGFLDLRRLEADHPEHFLQIRQRQHREALGGLGDFNAAVDQRRSGFLHRAKVARDVKHLLDGRAHDPETARIVEEHVVDAERTLFRNGNGNRAALGFEGIAPAHALSGSKNDRLSAVQNRLGGRGIGRKKLGESRHV